MIDSFRIKHNRLVPVIWNTVVEPWEVKLLHAIVQDEEEDISLQLRRKRRHMSKENRGNVFEFTAWGERKAKKPKLGILHTV